MNKTLAKIPDRMTALRVAQRLLLEFSRERRAPEIKFTTVDQSWEGLRAIAPYTTQPNFEIDGQLAVTDRWRSAVRDLMCSREDTVFADVWLKYEWGAAILHSIRTWRPGVPEVWRASAERWAPGADVRRSDEGRFVSEGISQLSEALGVAIGPERSLLPTGGSIALKCSRDTDEVAIAGSRREVRDAIAAFVDLVQRPCQIRATVAGSIAAIEQFRAVLAPGTAEQQYYHSYSYRSSSRGSNVSPGKLARLVRELEQHPALESFITFAGFRYTFTDEMDDGSNSVWWSIGKGTSPARVSLSSLDPIPRREIARIVTTVETWLNDASGETFALDLEEDEDLDDE